MNNNEKMKKRHPFRRDIILVIVLLALILVAVIFPRFKELREPVQEMEIIELPPFDLEDVYPPDTIDIWKAFEKPPPSDDIFPNGGHGPAPMPIGGAKAINNNLIYPDIDWSSVVKDRVILQALVNANGEATQVIIMQTCGNTVLDDAAKTAIMKTKFIPATINEKPVDVWVAIPVTLKPNSAMEEMSPKPSPFPVPPKHKRLTPEKIWEKYYREIVKRDPNAEPDLGFNLSGFGGPYLEWGCHNYDTPPSPRGGTRTFDHNCLSYPIELLKQGLEDTVKVVIFVEADGTLSLVRLFEPAKHKDFELAAIIAVAKSKWNPGQKDGKNIPVAYVYPVVFDLYNPTLVTITIANELQCRRHGALVDPPIPYPRPVDGYKAITDHMIYPQAERDAGIEGKVCVDVFVEPDSFISRIEIMKSSGYDALDQAAIETVRDLKFIPFNLDGVNIGIWTPIWVIFSLNHQSLNPNVPLPEEDLLPPTITSETELPNLEIPEGLEFQDFPLNNNSKIKTLADSKKTKMKRMPVKRTADDIWKRYYEIYVQSNPDLPKPGFGTYDFNHKIEIHYCFSKSPELIDGIKSIQDVLEYPELLKEAGIGDRILVMAYVDTNGYASSARIMPSSSSKCKFYDFEQAACKAIRNVKFSPAKLKDRSVSAEIWVYVEFFPDEEFDLVDQDSMKNGDLFFGLPVDPPYPLPNASWEDLNDRAIEKAGREAKGYTVIRTYIDRTGAVLKTQSVWPPTKTPEWNEAAISVIKNTKFKPAMLRGKIPVGVWFNIPVIFKLN